MKTGGESRGTTTGLSVRVMIIVSVAIVSVVACEFLRVVMLDFLAFEKRFFLWGETFSMHLVENQGTSFGFGLPPAWIYILSIVFMVVVIWIYVGALRKDKGNALAVGLIFGGALANFYERVVYFGVVDYWSIRYFSIFNLADVLIVVGVVLLIGNMLFWQEKKKVV